MCVCVYDHQYFTWVELFNESRPQINYIIQRFSLIKEDWDEIEIILVDRM